MYWIQGKHGGYWVWVFLIFVIEIEFLLSLLIFNLFLYFFQFAEEDATGGEQPQGRKVTLAGPKSDIGRAEKSHKGRNVTLECYNTASREKWQDYTLDGTAVRIRIRR